MGVLGELLVSGDYDWVMTFGDWGVGSPQWGGIKSGSPTLEVIVRCAMVGACSDTLDS